jgi:hypothetical protein
LGVEAGGYSRYPRVGDYSSYLPELYKGKLKELEAGGYYSYPRVRGITKNFVQ